MILYTKAPTKRLKIILANDAEVMMAALTVMKKHPKLSGMAASIELAVMLGQLHFGPVDEALQETLDALASGKARVVSLSPSHAHPYEKEDDK